MIITENFTIRALQECDLNIIYKWDTPEFRGDFQEYNLTSCQELTHQFHKNEFHNPNYQLLMIEQVNSSDPRLIGMLHLNFVREGLIKIGLVLHPDFRHLGLGTAITKTFLTYLFDNFQVARIEADTDINNKAAQRTLENAGFEREGILRNYRFHHGAYHDFALYSKLR